MTLAEADDFCRGHWWYCRECLNPNPWSAYFCLTCIPIKPVEEETDGES